MRRLLHAAVAATAAFALYAVGATLFAAPAEAQRARGTDGIFYLPYVTNRVVFEGTGEVDNIFTSNRGTDIDPDTPGIQVRGIMYFATGCFAPRRPGTLTVTARIVSGDRGAVGIVVRTNGVLQCVYAWAKTDVDRRNDSVRVRATAVLTSNGTEVDRFEDTFTVEQRDTKSGVGEAAPLDLTAPPPRAFTARRAIDVPALPAASGGSGSYSYALTGQGGAARPLWLGFDPALRRMSGTPPASAAGTTATLDYTVDDGRTSQTRSFTVTVNAAPSLSAPSNRTYTAGTAITAFTLSAATGGTAPLRYELSGLPGGLVFNPGTRRLSGTPLAATATPATVTYRVTDANGATDTDTFTITVNAATGDTTAPTVASIERQMPSDEDTNANSLTFLVTFSEDVENVGTTDFAVTAPGGGTATTARVTGAQARNVADTANATQPARVFRVTVSGGNLESYEGTVGLGFATGQNIADEADNALANTTPTGVNQSYALDNTAPTATLAPPASHDGSSAFDVTVTFSEDVTGFSAVADLTINGGALTGGANGITRTNARTYAARITPSGTGNVTVRVPANAANDDAGNGNAASTTTTVDYVAVDTTAPTVTSIERQAPSDEDTNANSLTFRVTFSEAVENVGTGDFAVTAPGGGTATTARVTGVQARNVADTANATQPARVFRVTVSSGNLASYEGTVGLGFATGQNIADEADNALANTTPTGVNQSYALDNTAPTATLAPPASHDGSSAFDVTVTFSEDVTGFSAVADLTINGGALTGGANGITRTNAKTYTARITPSGTGNVTVRVPANAAEDDAGNGNAASTTATVGYVAVDTTAPTVVSIERQTPSDEDTNANSLTFRVTFSEDVENVGTTDFAVTEPGGGTATTARVTGAQARNAADTANATQPARVFRVTVSSGNLASYEGTVGLGFATGQNIADEAGNALTATLPAGTNYETYTLDNTAPTPALSVVPAKHDGGSASEVTVDFSEAVTGFVVGDITVTGGTKTGFAGSDGDSSYTVTVTPTGNANITVTVAAGVADDRAGNASLVAADSVTVEYAAPQAFSWQATLMAGESTGYHGYCGSSCLIAGVGPHGTLADDSNDARFTLPGPGFAVEVAALSRVGNRLHVGLETVSSVHGTWTLDWDGAKQVTLSGRSRVGSGGDLEFDNFFADIDNIDEGETVEVCIIGHGGVSACTRDATLSALTLTDGSGTAVALDQTFAAGTTAYTASVGNDVETVTVAATATDSDDATVAFTPTDADSTTNGHQIDLDVGENTITVMVTNGTATQDYTLTVTREAAATADTTLSALTLTAPDDSTVALSPAFASATTAYTAAVRSDVASVTVAATATATGATVSFAPADADASTTGHQVSLTEGANTITATVTDGGDTGSYTVTVTRVAPATLTVGNDTVVEGGTLEFPVSVDNAVPGGFTVTVSFRHLGSSPATYPDQTLTFEGDAGESHTATAATTGDAVPQSGARFVDVKLEASRDAIDDSDTARGRIFDDDSGVIAMANATAAEGEDLTFTVVLTAGRVAGGFEVTLSYGGGATSGTDYTPNTETLTFDGTLGREAHSFTVAALTDSVDENDETFTVTATPSAVGVPAVTATGTITNVAPADTTAPTVASVERQSPSDEDTNANSLTFLVTFSEDVENVGTGDFTVTAPGGGTATTAGVSGVQARNDADDANATEPASVFRVTVSSGNLGSYEGTVGLGFATGQDIEDEAGNDLVATLPAGTNYETYTLDNTAPTVASIERQTPSDEDTNANSLTFLVTFSETVENVATTDFTVTEPGGGTATTATVSGVQARNDADTANATEPASVFRVTVSSGNLASYDGTVGLGFASGQNIADEAGNDLTATLPAGTSYETYTLDNTAPTPTLSAVPTTHDGSSTSTSVVTVIFGEPVTGFVTGDITVTGGTKSNFTGASGASSYTVTVAPTGTADITVAVAAGAANDRAGNASLTATDLTVDYTEALALTAPDDMVFTATRAISVDALPAATGAVGTVTYNLTGASGGALPTWLTFTASTRVMSGTPQDAATAVTLEYTATDNNGTADDATDDVTTDPATFTVTVNAAPTLAAVDDRIWTKDTAITALELPQATGGTGPFAYALTGTLPDGLTWNDSVTPQTITGTPTTVASAVELTYTATDANGAAARTAFDVTIVETLALGKPDDLVYTQVEGAYADAVTLPAATGGATPYTYDLLNPSGSSLASTSIPSEAGGGQVFDAATRQVRYPILSTAAAGTLTYSVTDTAGTKVTQTFDITINRAPTLVAVDDQSWSQYVAIETLNLPAATGGTAPFGYAVANLPAGLTFDKDKRDITGRPTTATTAAVTVTYTATDANDVAVSRTFDVTVASDETAPTVLSIERHDGTDAQDENTNADSLTFRVTFSEDVVNVGIADFAASGASGATATTATATGVTGSGDTYIVTLGSGDLAAYNGEVGLDFATDQNIADEAGNALTATLPSGAETYTLDNTAPAITAVVRNTPTAEFTNRDQVRWAVTFSEAVNLEAGAFTLTPAVASTQMGWFDNSSGAKTTYVVRAFDTGIANHNGTIGLALDATKITDDTANELSGGLPNDAPTFTLDNTRPRPTLSAVPATHDGESTSTSVVTVSFGEPVTGFVVGDITVTGGTKSNFTGASGASSYTVTVAPTGSADITVSVSANVANDRAGNANLAAATDLTVDYTEALALTAPDDMVFTATRAISVDALPAATGAVGTVTYNLTGASGGALPAWLSFTAATRVMSGTPQDAATAVTLEYTATDNNGTADDATDDVTTDPATFTVTVNAAPTLAAVDDRIWTKDTAITALELPQATGGTGPFAYALTGTLPDGLTWNDSVTPQTITGTPTTVASAVELTYTATDANGAAARTAFDVTIVETLALGKPDDLVYTQVEGAYADAVTLPAATGGATPYTYDLLNPSGSSLASTSIPSEAGGGQVFDAATRQVRYPILSTAAAGTLTYSVTDTAGTKVTQTFDITINRAPTLVAVDDQSWSQYVAIETLNLPAATGGTAPFGYAVANLPAGLTFDKDKRDITGRPTTATTAAVTVTYTATDANDVAVSRTFDVTVASDETAPTVLSIERHDGTDAQDENTNADSLTFRVTFSEDVVNVDTADFAASGASGATATTATATGVTGSGDTYIVTLGSGDLAAYNGEVGLDFATDQNIADEAGNALTATLPSGAETYTLDNTAPAITAVVRNTPTTEFTNRDQVRWAVTFSEAVNLEAGAFTLTPAVASTQMGWFGNSGGARTEYVVRVFGTGIANHNGTIGLALDATKITDDTANELSGGLPNDAPTFTLDNTRPRPTLSAVPATHDGESTSTSVVTVSFGEPVTGFVAGDITVTGGTKSNFTGASGASSYTVTVAPTGSADITVSVAANVANDRAGNRSLAATDLTVDYTDELALTAPDDMVFTATRAISVDALPAATGAVGTVTYNLTGASGGALPAWLSFTAATRVMSGTPQDAATAVTLEYTATDNNGTADDATDDVTTDPVTFTVTVNAAPTLAAVDDQTYEAGKAIPTLSLPEATNGVPLFTYELEGPSGGALPAGLEFDGTTDPPQLTGTPTTPAAAVTLTYTATDANGAEVEVEFDVTIEAAAAPEAFAWQATLSVVESSNWYGYCGSSCPINAGGGRIRAPTARCPTAATPASPFPARKPRWR